MAYIDLLDIRNSSHSFELSIYAVKEAGCIELALPGIRIIACHIVIRMITCYNHQITQNYLLVSCVMYLLDNRGALGICRLTLNGSDEYVLVTKIIHFCLHLIIGDIRLMRGSMAHEYKRRSVSGSRVKAVISCLLYRCSSKNLCNVLLVLVYYARVTSYLTQKRLSDFHGIKFICVFADGFCQLVILRTMHQMGRLNQQILHAVVHRSLECLIHVVDHLIITRLNVIDDDLRRECTSYRPVRIRRLESLLDSADILHTAVIIGSSERAYKNLVFSDSVLVERIILGGIAGISSEIIRICILALYQSFLCIRQSVPGLLCRLAVLVRSICSLLHVDLVNQSGYLVRCCLIRRYRRGRNRLYFFRRGGCLCNLRCL